MLTEIESGKAIWLGIIGLLAGILAYYADEWHPGIRIFLAGLAVICWLIFGFWTLDLLGWLGSKVLAAFRLAWNAPKTRGLELKVRQMEMILRMSPDHLAALGKGIISLDLNPDAIGLVPTWQTPTMALGFAEVQELFEICLDLWPNIPQQWGLGETNYRKRLQAFTYMVIALGLADRINGKNRPAVWTVTQDVAARTLMLPHFQKDQHG